MPGSPFVATLIAENLSHRVYILLALRLLQKVVSSIIRQMSSASSLSYGFSSLSGHLSLTIRKDMIQCQRGFLRVSNWDEEFCSFDKALNLQLYTYKACARTTTSSTHYGCISGRANPRSHSMNFKLRGACSKH